MNTDKIVRHTRWVQYYVIIFHQHVRDPGSYNLLLVKNLHESCRDWTHGIRFFTECQQVKSNNN